MPSLSNQPLSSRPGIHEKVLIINCTAAISDHVSSMLTQIRAWAATELKYWEQAALEKITEGNELSEQEYDDLAQCFLQDAGLTPTAARPKLSFPKSEPLEAAKGTCCLRKIFNLKHVNALPEGQMVEFGSRLTLIYRANGAGKTGYARPLGCAGSRWQNRSRPPSPSPRRTTRMALHLRHGRNSIRVTPKRSRASLNSQSLTALNACRTEIVLRAATEMHDPRSIHFVDLSKPDNNPSIGSPGQTCGAGNSPPINLPFDDQLKVTGNPKDIRHRRVEVPNPNLTAQDFVPKLVSPGVREPAIASENLVTGK